MNTIPAILARKFRRNSELSQTTVTVTYHTCLTADDVMRELERDDTEHTFYGHAETVTIRERKTVRLSRRNPNEPETDPRD